MIEKDQAYMTYSLSGTESVPPMILMEPNQIPKEEFIAFIHSLHMGEWQKDYSTNRHNNVLLDSVFWEVDVFHENGLGVNEFDGLNVFPYNFSAFHSFFESHKKKIERI